MTDSSSDGGCLGLLVCIVLLWAVCFGVTVNGHHYGIDLSCEKGVEVQK
jgi:hypothetical protein